MYRMPFHRYRGIDYTVGVKIWCREHIGEPTPNFILNFDQGGAWFVLPNAICFQREQDATFYALRWL